MADQAQGAASLSVVISDAATEIALALRGGGDSFALSRVLRPEDPLAHAAVRVLGADALAPYRLAGHRPLPEDALLVDRALDAFPPEAGSSAVSLWSYHGLAHAAGSLLPDGGGRGPAAPRADALPDTGWVREEPWPRLAHLSAQLAALAVPTGATPLADALRSRTEDLARGFVRAVRRRDWLQAAGLGRWLTVLPDTPQTLALDRGLDFVRLMSAADPRVQLQVAAAKRLQRAPA